MVIFTDGMQTFLKTTKLLFMILIAVALVGEHMMYQFSVGVRCFETRKRNVGNCFYRDIKK